MAFLLEMTYDMNPLQAKNEWCGIARYSVSIVELYDMKTSQACIERCGSARCSLSIEIPCDMNALQAWTQRCGSALDSFAFVNDLRSAYIAGMA